MNPSTSLPRVTVLMPVFNAERYLREAIDSVLNQTFTDFELLIINDGSTDSSREIILSYKDKRIRYHENETNLRLIATLNKGIEMAAGEYIARMDADDVCLPERLEKQVAFMDKHPQVGLLGAFMRTIGLEKDYDIHFSTAHDEIKFKLFFDTHFPHPAAMIKKGVLAANNLKFDDQYIHAEDFDLWNRMANVCHLAILPEILVHKRSHTGQVSVVHVQTQNRISRKIREELIQRLEVTLHPGQMDIYEDFLQNKIPLEREKMNMLLDMFEAVEIANNKAGIYNRAVFGNFFAEKYWQLCTRSTALGYWVYKKYMDSIFGKDSRYKRRPLFRFLIKSLIRYSYS